MCADAEDCERLLVHRPIILSPFGFETFVAATVATQKSIDLLISEKQNETNMGEWTNYFAKIFRDFHGKPLPAVQEAIDKMYIDLGVPPDL
jgi:hypothetical protein